jgi:hypothetical protein
VRLSSTSYNKSLLVEYKFEPKKARTVKVKKLFKLKTEEKLFTFLVLRPLQYWKMWKFYALSLDIRKFIDS